MQKFLEKLILIFKDKTLRKRIFFVALFLVLFRLGAAIPIPGVDATKLAGFLSGNQFFGLLNIFSGGGLSNLSIMMLGVGPYITGSIILQLLTMIFPALKKMYHEEGEAGKKKFAQYSRMLTVPLAMIQGFGLLTILRREGILADVTVYHQVLDVLVVTAGSVLLMWIGELMTEYGIGNGVSLIIFAGIVSRIPTDISRLFYTFDISQIPLYLAFLAVAVIIIGGVVVITEAERPIPITYAKRIRGMKVYGGTSTYLPLRVNQAGVMPIIFALSILLFPQLIASILNSFGGSIAQTIAGFFTYIVSNQIVYGASYFILVVLFTYFYTAVTFDPEQISNNLQKGGAFIPGVRPGKSTAEYLSNILVRLTLFGALFLGIIAILPLIMQSATGNSNLAIGGTSLLIVVSVVIELLRQLDAQISMREY
ncbi:MAG: preprotein translocase subunit SecY [Candidatus Paceibacterota bacterium]